MKYLCDCGEYIYIEYPIIGEEASCAECGKSYYIEQDTDSDELFLENS